MSLGKVTQRQLKYRWERTSEDTHADFTAWDGDICFGRVRLHTTGPIRMWTWFMNADHDWRFHPSDGNEVDKIEACRQVEAAYDEAKKKARQP